MKLVVITAIQEFKNQIKSILLKANVKSYSHSNVTGFRNSSLDSVDSNWFGTEMNESESVLFYAFMPEENANKTLSLFNQFNEKLETLSRIHIAIINIEQSN